MAIHKLNPACSVSLMAALATPVFSTCAGPDRLLEPVIAEGGNFFASLGGNPGTSGGAQNAHFDTTGTVGLGGSATSQTSSRTLADATGFAWNNTTNDANGGANVSYQGHFTGMACIAACHVHTFTLGGTVYQSNGTATAANAQVGILVSGNLTATYSGNQGNFHLSIPSAVDWATAEMAVRTERGTFSMPVNSSANGNCNNCHKDSSNRIVVP